MEESASGTFVADVPIPQRGRLVEGLSWTFRNGKVTDFTARKNLPFAQTNWAEATGSKDVFGEVSFGLNSKALPGFMQNSIVSGTVSISIGDNRGAGGKNDSSYGFSAPIAHGTVEIGGKTVIRNGLLVCTAHHRLLHEGGWRIEREPDGWAAISPRW